MGDLAPPVELDVPQELGVVRHLAKYFVISGEMHFQAMRVSTEQAGIRPSCTCAIVQQCNDALVLLCNVRAPCNLAALEWREKAKRFTGFQNCENVIFNEEHSK